MSAEYPDYVPPLEAWEVAEKLADALYNKGYRDSRKEMDKDARACDEWQEVVDAIRRIEKYKDMAL